MTLIGKMKLRNNILHNMNGMSQRELAIRAGLTEKTIGRIMNLQFKKMPTCKSMYHLSIALGCHTQDLLKGIEMEELL